MIDYEKAYSILREVTAGYRSDILSAVSEPDLLQSYRHSDGVDVSTDLDIRIENSLKKQLQNAFPDTGFYLEEAENENADNEYVWYIDPIDGTKHFHAGFPGFACSVGLIKNNDPVAGFIYDFMTDATFFGADTIPSMRNDKPISVLDESDPAKISIELERSVKYVGWEKDKPWFWDKYNMLVDKFYRVRYSGLGVLASAMIAGGSMNMGAIVLLTGDKSTKPVDIAGGRALVKYAGGIEKRIPVTGLSFDNVLAFGSSSAVDIIEKIVLS